jgi:hypothetical protein
VLKPTQKDRNRENKQESTEVAFCQYVQLLMRKPDQYQGVKKLNDFDTDAENHNPLFFPVRECLLVGRGRFQTRPPLGSHGNPVGAIHGMPLL